MSSKAKQALKTELLAKLHANLTILEAAHADAMAGATHEEAKPESDKDTRAVEQSYLARGQAVRIETLKQGLAKLNLMTTDATTVITIGSLVDAEEDDEVVRFLIAPEGGGTKLKGGVQVITPTSPLAQALLGKTVDDACEVLLAGKSRSFVIVKVS